MRTLSLVLGVCAFAVGPYCMGQQTGVQGSLGPPKPTGLIVSQKDGERREFRTRPGTYFTLKLDPKNGNSKQMVVMTEDMAVGDRIPTHRHPNADELIIIHTGTARVTLGDRIEEVHAGDIIFIPRDTWIGAENIGTEHLTLTGVFSASGYEEYLRAISVIAGQPVVPLSKGELDEIRKKHVHDGIYQDPSNGKRS